MPVQVDRVRRDQPVAEQVQPQLGVRRVGRRGLQVVDHGADDELGPDAAHLVDALEPRPGPGGARSLVGGAEPRAGNQVSSTPRSPCVPA